jgi:hypothetical protein
MEIRRVSAALFDAKADLPKQPGPRELKRMALERRIGRAIKGAASDGGRIAFQLILQDDDRPSTIRAAFMRVRAEQGASDVNMLGLDGKWFIAKRPQRRGRRPATGQ